MTRIVNWVDTSMVEGMSRIYTWVIIITDILLSVILSFLVFWRGVVHPVLFVTAAILPVVALGYNRGVKEAKGANLVIGITLLSYFLTVNYYLIMLPSTQFSSSCCQSCAHPRRLCRTALDGGHCDMFLESLYNSRSISLRRLTVSLNWTILISFPCRPTMEASSP